VCHRCSRRQPTKERRKEGFLKNYICIILNTELQHEQQQTYKQTAHCVMAPTLMAMFKQAAHRVMALPFNHGNVQTGSSFV